MAAATSVNIIAFVVALVLVLAGGVWFLRRVDDSDSDRQVARSGAGVEAARVDVETVAGDRGWTVTRHPSSEPLTQDRAPRRAEPRRCEFLVLGSRPRPFRAATWRMAHRNAGAVATSPFLQHRVSLDLARDFPDFAVSGVASWRLMLASIPDPLVGHPQVVAGLDVYGDDRGAAAALAPLAEEVRAAQVWIVVSGHTLVLVREGELDATGLTARLELADRVAGLLEG
jgi:hypothetical protein